MENLMIGDKIAQARKRKNLSQAQLAQQVFVSPQAVGKWERGESLPDVVTLNRLAVIMGVDLNYFMESAPAADQEQAEEPKALVEEIRVTPTERPISPPAKRKPIWDMSQGNWVDADFSGLSNLHERLRASNIRNCKFICSDLSGLQMGSNNVEKSDFTGSNIGGSRMVHSNLEGDRFVECDFTGTHFSTCNISNCDFTRADLSQVSIQLCSIQKTTLSHAVLQGTSFRASSLTDVVFEGTLQDCSFENCSFGRVTFQNAQLLNTFFKGRALKRIQFIDCEADRLTYEFLKNGKADVSGIKIVTTETA
jgi:uncharacterized protein YjbI with pentapeptide repeats